jgi:hypothetical protein
VDFGGLHIDFKALGGYRPLRLPPHGEAMPAPTL